MKACALGCVNMSSVLYRATVFWHEVEVEAMILGEQKGEAARMQFLESQRLRVRTCCVVRGWPWLLLHLQGHSAFTSVSSALEVHTQFTIHHGYFGRAEELVPGRSRKVCDVTS
jgi:hypothetical protein